MKQELHIYAINTSEKAGLALRRLRKHFGLSQTQLAKKMNMRQPTISDVENGKGTLESFFKIIRALHVNVSIGSGKPSSQKKTKNTAISVLLDLLRDTEDGA
jgi:transcriptional regulator with XRE-family HTH domain